MSKDAVEEWLQIRRDLMAMEADFTSLAIQLASAGDGSVRLQQARDRLEALRARCTAAYERAFPGGRSSSGSTSISGSGSGSGQGQGSL